MKNNLVKSRAIEIGQIKGFEYWVTPMPLLKGLLDIPVGFPNNLRQHMVELLKGLNGYIVFPKRPVNDDILKYVPICINYICEDDIGTVYGFDTCHFSDMNTPNDDTRWIKGKIAMMLDGILMAQEIHGYYMRACVECDSEAQQRYGDLIYDAALGNIPLPEQALKQLLEGVEPL